MTIKNKLQIYLITYNRKIQLERTLTQILAKDSPVRNFDITILDNASTDGSSELIDEYCKNFPNLKHIRHKVNIGGNANACRAFELGASCGKEYVWVLCDDDAFDWTSWKEIEEQISNSDKDIIFTINNLGVEVKNPAMPVYLFWASFIPGCIYKTEHIAPRLINMYGTIGTWFPQAMLSLDILINKQGKYYMPNGNFKSLIIRTTEEEFILSKTALHRGCDRAHMHEDLERMYWHIGYMKALKIVKNKQIRQQLCEKVHFTQDFEQTDKAYIRFVLWFNKTYRNGNLDNYWDIFSSVSFQMKLYIVFYFFTYPILNNIYIYKTKKDIRLCLFGLKFKILPRFDNNGLVLGGGGGNSTQKS